MTTLFLVAALVAQAGPPGMVALPGGGFAPCDHPLAIEAGLGCTPTPAPLPPGCTVDQRTGQLRCIGWPPLAPTFQLGRTYTRPAGQGPTAVFVAGIGQGPGGDALVFLLCLQDCSRAAQVDAVPAGTAATGWTLEARP